MFLRGVGEQTYRFYHLHLAFGEVVYDGELRPFGLALHNQVAFEVTDVDFQCISLIDRVRIASARCIKKFCSKRAPIGGNQSLRGLTGTLRGVSSSHE